MEKLTELSKVLKALSDKTRLKIITLLSYRPHCVCELSEIIGYSQPTISRHLQILAEAGIVKFKKEKFFIIYYLAPQNDFIEKILNIIMEKIKEKSLYKEFISKTTPNLSLKGLENFQEVF
jgi:ArsR family transcriptional regulator